MILKFFAAGTFVAAIALIPAQALAHRDGCHRWHSCPSDTGSYICGDMGYYDQCPNRPAPATSAPTQTPQRPVESAYDRYMRIGYDASRNRDYQTALINFRRALQERPGDRAATQAAVNMEAAIQGGSNSASNNFTWLSQRRVTTADLEGKSDFELDVLRNSIFARYGRRFDRADLQAYFERQSWYTPRYTPSQFPSNLLTALEQSNVQFILNHQRSH